MAKPASAQDLMHTHTALVTDSCPAVRIRNARAHTADVSLYLSIYLSVFNVTRLQRHIEATPEFISVFIVQYIGR